MRDDNSGHDVAVHIVSAYLKHTNGCNESDTLMNNTMKKYRGRKYSDDVLQCLHKKVNMGRYSTTDVKNWLIDQGLIDAYLEEATNL